MGRFKPLLPLGTTTVLQRVISIFQTAGVEDIRVITGHRADDIEPFATVMGVKTIFNADFKNGMFSSVQTGVQSLSPERSAFFVLPVDIPLVAPATVKGLLAAWEANRPVVAYPIFQGRRGHPPLISMGIRDHILNWSGHQGLRGALEALEDPGLEVETDDRYILMDMDRPEDYEQIQQWAQTPDHPAR
jgi:CTP:molybdopterin cytidylyltransferase MocA